MSDFRLPTDSILNDHILLAQSTQISCFNAFPLPLLILNEQRQILFSNQAFARLIGSPNAHSLLARRPGEALGCIYSDIGPSGCGTSAYCSECGALKAIVNSIATHAHDSRECQLLRRNEQGTTNAADIRIHVTPWQDQNQSLFVATLLDISHEKRRQMLERLFFHDILNAAGSARSLIDLLAEDIEEDNQDMVALAKSSLFALVEEIQKHRQLIAVEQNEYQVTPITLQGHEILNAICCEYRSHPKALNKHIELTTDTVNVPVYADFTILRRVLVNMVLNALEASREGDTVTLGLHLEGGQAVFRVHNSAVMPEPVRLQIFKRSFSTKGPDRGLGTYSIKLLTENYLRGTTGFTSTEDAGTTFYIALPATPGATI